MDLDAMLQREDFFSILFATVKQYFKEVYNEDVTLSFADGALCANAVIYPRLSAISSVNLSRKARAFFRSEWNVRGSIPKNLLVKAYVCMMLCSHGLFAKYRFSVVPSCAMRKDVVIAPNNRSIRFFDYSCGTVGCIVKNGFTDKYFRNQLQFRLNHSYPFLLPMTRWGENWFIEPVLFGHPLARVTNGEIYNNATRKAVDEIGIVARDTMHFVACSEYASAMESQLHILLDAARKKKIIDDANLVQDVIHRLAVPCRNSTLQIPLVLSHGDFQSGNIWVENDGSVILYDWETVGERSVWYDTTTLLLSLRRAGGVERLWRGWRNPGAFASIASNDPQKVYSIEQRSEIARIILLEDIKFHLDDMLELPNDWGSDIFNRYFNCFRLLDI